MPPRAPRTVRTLSCDLGRKQRIELVCVVATVSRSDCTEKKLAAAAREAVKQADQCRILDGHQMG